MTRLLNFVPYDNAKIFFICLCIFMNFKKSGAIPPAKKPLFPGYENGYSFQEQPKRSVSFLTLFIVIILTFAVALLLFKKFDTITSRFTSSIHESTGFEIGQTVSLSGMIQNDGDLITYTHTLTMADTTIVGIKSRTMDLNLYTGMVDIQGMIEKEYNDIFIIEVQAIS